MKLLLVVVALVAVWVRGSDGVACEDVTICTPDISVMESADAEGIAKLCRSVRSAIQCFRDAMKDCRHHGSIPEDTIRTLENQINSYDSMLTQYCGDNGGTSDGRGGGSPYDQGVSVKSSLLVTVVLALFAAIL